MRNDVVIYKIELPAGQDAGAFVTFMREEYLPAVYLGPTRAGQTMDLVLWQAEPPPDGAGHHFFLHMVWSGIRGSAARIRLNDDTDSVESKLQSFGANLQRLGLYTEAARWSEDRAETVA
ncbi:hypothetical protein V3W47_03650 [Deinococcus sp. YIM 134068]|uniref:hypothetical protein n=1 Tax=Deinococcus lichenicola TaxID=3118910 RepID=UPI002F95209C